MYDDYSDRTHAGLVDSRVNMWNQSILQLRAKDSTESAKCIEIAYTIIRRWHCRQAMFA